MNDIEKETDKNLSQILEKVGIKDIVKIGLVFVGKRIETNYYI